MYFESIIGQNFAKKYITNSIRNEKINHAYMFEGIDGIGKNKFSEELGKILLKTTNLDSCPDYINVNANGSSIKIAQIRNLQTDIIIKPHKDYKIYVINNCDKMTIEAQNALLKTLEEPPEYAIIILVTSNKEALLDTIKSRCEIIKFLPISTNELKSFLIKNGIEENRAKFLATFSRGSIKEALELSYSSEFITMREDIQYYIETIISKDLVEILDIPSNMERYRSNIINILDLMVNYFRDAMLLKEKVDTNMIINADKLVFVQNISKRINYSQVSKIIDIIEETKKKIKSNCNFNISMQVMALNIYEVIK